MLERASRRLVAWMNEHTIEVVVALLIVLFLAVVFAQQVFVNIPAGSVGVVWHRFSGTDVCHPPLSEGLKLKFPWDEIYTYNIRLTQADQDVDVLSIDGLKLRLNIAYRYELNPNYAAYLHQLVGPQYETVLIGSDIAAHSRDILSAHTPEQIYSSQRSVIEGDIRSAVEDHLRSGFNPDYLGEQASSAPNGINVSPIQRCSPSPAPSATPIPAAAPARPVVQA
nr:SPFH domain-containing protein [Candidatus Eremiobacteraeota bacterium]